MSITSHSVISGLLLGGIETHYFMPGKHYLPIFLPIGRTYLIVLISCFLFLLALFLLFFLCNKYVWTKNKKSWSRASTLSTFDGSIIKYDALRLVYNTTLEHQQVSFLNYQVTILLDVMILDQIYSLFFYSPLGPSILSTLKLYLLCQCSSKS